MWTTTKPTKPGRYGWRPDKAPWRTVEQQPELLELVEYRGKLVIERSCADIDPRRGEWWDAPIVLPWEAQPEPVSAELERMRGALEKIAKWNGEFPTVFRAGKLISFEGEFGSNGERDYMREVARAALLPSPTIPTE